MNVQNILNTQNVLRARRSAMDPILRVALAFGLFAVSHIALAWLPVRQFLVARLGQWGFTVLFSVTAWITFAAAISTYAAHAGEGPAGLALGAHAPARFALVAVIAVGSMLGGAHALLATRLVGAVAMGSLAGLALAGAWLQDRKLLALRGEPYAAYLASTSTVPFAAIAAGRQRPVWAELPYGMLSLGLALAWPLRAVHANLFDHGGAYVIAAFVIGPLAILLSGWRREQRARRRAPTVAGG
jgi:hypothetical protein